MKVSGLCFTI